MKVLIANFEETMNEFLKDLFKDLGVESFFVEQGDETLTMAKTLQPDIYLLILNNIFFSPSIDSALNRIERAIDIVAKLKASVGNKPIIGMSGSNAEQIESKARAAGVDYFFRLPFKVEELEKVIEKYKN
ncbi:MAG: response regulator [Candidatus Omnitrophica bacterium]|nr:response regulator [Candidatus Omnitrophota bacterium]